MKGMKPHPVLAATAALTCLAGCGLKDHPEIVGVTTKEGSSRIGVTVASCNEEPAISVTESASEIALQASIGKRYPLTSQDACTDAVWVDLSAPVGDRSIVDSTTGREVMSSSD